MLDDLAGIVLEVAVEGVHAAATAAAEFACDAADAAGEYIVDVTGEVIDVLTDRLPGQERESHRNVSQRGR